MKFITAILLCSCLTFFSCTKKKTTVDKPVINTDLKTGFPNDIRAINGYFYAQVQKYHSSYNNNSNYIFSAYGISSDPPKNLISTYNHYNGSSGVNFSGNVDVGPMAVNGNYLTPQNFGTSITYQYANGNLNFASPPNPVSWQTKGNGSFKALEVAINRGFPVIIDTYTNTSQGYTVNISNGYTLNFGDFISNYDSLIISVQAYGPAAVIKRLTPGVSSVNFSSSDLSPVLSGYNYGTLNIFAYNYSNKITENVCNVFELSNRLSVDISVLP